MSCSSRVRLALCAGLVMLAGAGCGAHAAMPRAPTVDDLRRTALERPDDAAVQRELAFAEMLMSGGSPQRAGAQIVRALALSEGDERLLFLAGLHDELRGSLADALGHYLDALDAARASTRAQASFVAEVAVMAVSALEGAAPQWVERVLPRMRAATAEPGHMGVAAHHLVTGLLIEIAYRRGDAAEVRRLSAAQGCITSWRVAGPFGPRELLGFDRSWPAAERGALLDTYDLGPGRGEQATREVESRGCAAHLGGGPVAAGGTTFAEAFVELPEAGGYVLQLETPNSVELRVDGERVARLDRRRLPTPRVTYHHLTLSAGRHEVSVQVTTRHPNPVLVASITRAGGLGLGARAAGPGPARDASLAQAGGAGSSSVRPSRPDGGPSSAERPAGSGPFAAYLKARVSVARGDPVGAREALRGPITGRGATEATLQLRAAIALSDPLRPADMNRDDARRLLRRAARRDPYAWYPPVQLARLEAADGHVLAAIVALQHAEARWPNVVGIPLALADLVLTKGWTAQADLAIERAARTNPSACRPIRGALAAAQRRHRATRTQRLAARLVACDARSNALFQVLRRKRDWEGASREVERLGSLEPRSSRLGVLSAQLDVARGRGADAEIDHLLREMRALEPRATVTSTALADRLLAEGRPQEARQMLTSATNAAPAALAELRLLNHAIGAPFAFDRYRLDGAQVIRDFEASGRSYDAPQVLVLDYTVVRVFEDGSTLELTHNIWHVQSEEAVDQRGEFTPPQGARVLTLHTIKADGRRMEPDQIRGKSTISLPQVAPGDYVEYEYIGFGQPPRGFPGGYIGDRFYFRSFETPFDRSELTLILPEDMQPVVDPRGSAPPTVERVEGGLRVLHWEVHESRPLVPEPASIPAREWIPSINVGVGATWERFDEGLLDLLADADVVDPAARRQVMQILGEARRSSDMVKARRLYAWVLRNIEGTTSVFGLAPAMLAERNGNRGRILHYMLALAGVPSELVLARSAAGDATLSQVADGSTYQHLLVLVGEDEQQTFLSTVDRGAAFGYLPPPVRGQDALVLELGAPHVTVSSGVPEADRRSVEADVRLQEDGAATVEVVESFHGAAAVSWRHELEGIPEATLEHRFEEAYVSRLVPGAALGSLRITGREDPEAPLVFEYTFEVGALGRAQGAQWIVPGLFPSRLSPSYARTGSRSTTQLVTPPTDLDVVLRLHPPSGVTAPAPMSEVTLSGPGGASFEMHAARHDGALVVERQVRVPIQRVRAEDYPRFAGFCRAVDEAEARELRLRL